MNRKIYGVGDSMLPTFPKRFWINVHFFEKGEPKNLIFYYTSTIPYFPKGI